MRGLGISIQNILLNGSIKYMIFLKHDSDIFPKELSIILLQRNTIKENGAAFWFIKFVKKIDNSAFPRTRKTDKSSDFSTFDFHIHITQGFCAIRIRKINMRQFKIP